MASYEEACLPNFYEIENTLRDLEDFAKKPKVLKALKTFGEKGTRSNAILTESLNFRHAIRDFCDIEVPKRTADFPKSMLRLLALEKARQNSCIKYLKNCYIPVTHVLEYTKDWEKVDEIPHGTVRDRSEYGDDLEISSLRRLRGERAYL